MVNGRITKNITGGGICISRRGVVVGIIGVENPCRIPSETSLISNCRTKSTATICQSKFKIKPTAPAKVYLLVGCLIPPTVVQHDLVLDLEPHLVIDILVE